jgi:hypothetical protein
LALQNEAAVVRPEDVGLAERLLATPLRDLMAEAAALRDQAHPRIITFSPKVRCCACAGCVLLWPWVACVR